MKSLYKSKPLPGIAQTNSNINTQSDLIQSSFKLKDNLQVHYDLKKKQSKVKSYPILENQSQSQRKTQHNRRQIFEFMFKFAEKQQKMLIIVAIFINLLSGTPMCFAIWLSGKQIDRIFLNFNTLSSHLEKTRDYLLIMIGLGLINLVISIISFALWKYISQTLSIKYRLNYLLYFSKKGIQKMKSINLREVAQSFLTYSQQIQKWIGYKIIVFFNLIGFTICGVIMSLLIRWTLTLFLLSLAIFSAIFLTYFIVNLINKNKTSKDFSQLVNKTTTKLIEFIKVIKRQGNQQKYMNSSAKLLNQHNQQQSSLSFKLALSTSLFFFIQFLAIGIGFLYSIQCVKGTAACPLALIGSRYTLGQIITVFLQLFFYFYYYLQFLDNKISKGIDFMTEATDDRFKQLQILNRIYQLSGQNIQNDKKQEQIIVESISFKNVTFSKPSNHQNIILQDVNINLVKHKLNVILTTSNQINQAIYSLLLRFDQPNQGIIKINYDNILTIDKKLLRRSVGLIEQQPVVFSGTIRQNISLGKQNPSDEDIYDSLIRVNLKDFVDNQENNLNFIIEKDGSNLSYEQKRKISIARILIKKPKILIFNEESSATDIQTQIFKQIIQRILLQVNNNITILLISQDLRSSIKADKIWYIDDGVVKNEGTFQSIQSFKQLRKMLTFKQQSVKIIQQKQDIRQSQNKQHISNEQISDKNILTLIQTILKLTESKKIYIVIILLSVLCGLLYPGVAILLGYVFNNIINFIVVGQKSNWCASNEQNCFETIDGPFDEAIKYCFVIIGLSILAMIFYFMRAYFTSQLSIEIKMIVQTIIFNKIVSIPISVLEKYHQNQSEQESSVESISKLMTQYISTLITILTTIISAIIVCLVYFWQFGLISIATIPLLCLSGYLSFNLVERKHIQNLQQENQLHILPTQLIVNFKSALLCNYAERLIINYRLSLNQSIASIVKKGINNGILYGLSSFITIVIIALSLFSMAHILVQLNKQSFLQPIIVLTVSILCGWVSGSNFFFTSDYYKLKQSLIVLSFLQQKSEIQNHNERMKKSQLYTINKPSRKINGKIQFKNVSSNQQKNSQKSGNMIYNMNLLIESGLIIGFVGDQNSGKQVIVDLLMRFYDYSGQICLDDKDISQYDLKTYRSYFFINNVAIKSKENRQKQIIDRQYYNQMKDTILQKQNQDKFKLITQLETKQSGQQLTYKNFPIFMIRQDNFPYISNSSSLLKQSMENKTVLYITDNIQTMKNCDAICFMSNGQIVEMGTHDELMLQKNFFFRYIIRKCSKLYQKQNLMNLHSLSYKNQTIRQDQNIIYSRMQQESNNQQDEQNNGIIIEKRVSFQQTIKPNDNKTKKKQSVVNIVLGKQFSQIDTLPIIKQQDQQQKLNNTDQRLKNHVFRTSQHILGQSDFMISHGNMTPILDRNTFNRLSNTQQPLQLTQKDAAYYHRSINNCLRLNNPFRMKKQPCQIYNVQSQNKQLNFINNNGKQQSKGINHKI